jgi:hypothetical protein
MSNPRLGQPVKNKHKVPQKMWTRWSNHAKGVFNGVMEDMRLTMQFVYLHPDCPPLHKEHWHTVRRNASFVAADRANKLATAQTGKAPKARKRKTRR